MMDFFSIPKDAKILPHVNEETGKLSKVEPYHKLDAIPKQVLCEDNCPICQFLKEQYAKLIKMWKVNEVVDEVLNPRLHQFLNSYDDLNALEEL